MSRTDIHRPEWVQQRDPRVRHWFADFHHHPEGRCDLGDFLAWPGWVRTRCYRQVWRRSPNLCGCQLCTGQASRKLARRQERVRWRAIRHELLAAHRGGHRDHDVPPIRGKAW